MAILLEEGEKKLQWKGLAAVLGILLLLVGISYALFFAEAPKIEIVIPQSVRSTSELSQVQFDPASVVNSASFRALRRYVGEQTTGVLGRQNPFIKF